MSDLCACGCGESAPEGKEFRRGHWSRTPAAKAIHVARRQAIEVPNPDGLCMCGCGQPTPLATSNRPERGYYKGQPMRYILGHQVQGGEKHARWKGGRYKDSSGYVHIYRPDHPEADRDGHVREHRAVVMEVLGRALRPEEHVHHINGIKDDNRPENLVALAWWDHLVLHGTNELAEYHKTHPEASREAGRRGAAARWGKKE